jgi:dihydroorotase
MQTLKITKPDDWHVHFRDGILLEHTVPATARHFSRTLVMPNLKPPLTTIELLLDYRERILRAIPSEVEFTPYFSFYLNESVTADTLAKAVKTDFILGAKLYPAGATTNSEAGVKSLLALYPLLEIMQKNNQVLQIHGEVVHGDIFEREGLFLEEQLRPLMLDFPNLRIVLEHISTSKAVDFVLQAPVTLAATITPHHLYYNRNHLLAGGIKPHYYCLPILKHQNDQLAIQKAATSGNPKFFAGTDSAPHAIKDKESACGCAGIYSAPYALALYTQVFDELNQLSKLDAFLSKFGAEFYLLPVNKKTITLEKKSQIIPAFLPLGRESVIPIAAGESLLWSVK